MATLVDMGLTDLPKTWAGVEHIYIQVQEPLLSQELISVLGHCNSRTDLDNINVQFF